MEAVCLETDMKEESMLDGTKREKLVNPFPFYLELTLLCMQCSFYYPVSALHSALAGA